jgi:hypothetical protein
MTVPAEIRDELESLGGNAEILRNLGRQLTTGNGVTPFVGAGMSVPLKYPGWGDFLITLSRDFGVETTVASQITSGQFEEAAQTCLQASGPGPFQDAISTTFGPSRLKGKPIEAAVRRVPEFTRGPIVTTNFDRVLEAVFERAGKRFEERVWGARAGVAVDGFFQNKRYLLKLHGDVIDTTDRILTRAEYEQSYGLPGKRYQDSAPPLHGMIRFIMTNRPLLFLGCSLNADRITGFLKDAYLQYGQLLHYAVVEAPATPDEHERRRNELWQYGIRPVWFPNNRFDVIDSVLLLALEYTRKRLRAAPQRVFARGEDAVQLANRKIAELATYETAGLSAEHYDDVVEALKQGVVVPFLGFGANLHQRSIREWIDWTPGMATRMPTGSEVAKYLATKFGYGDALQSGMDFARLCQYINETEGAVTLTNELRRIYSLDYPPAPAHWFLAALPQMLRQHGLGSRQPVIFTANYDDCVERAFEALQEPLEVLCYLASGVEQGRFVYRPVSGKPQVIRSSRHGSGLRPGSLPILVKLSGGFDTDHPDSEGLVVTEDDYIKYMGVTSAANLLPAVFAEFLRGAQFLFLGYSLRDWNIRALLQQIWSMQKPRRQSWAVLYRVNDIDKTLWTKRGVKMFDALVEDYIGDLTRRLTARSTPATAPE